MTTSRDRLAALLGQAEGLARTEIARVLVEPQRRLLTLLVNRSADLAQLEADIDALGITTERWGTF